MDEEGTALQKARKIPIRSLVLIHLNIKLNLVQHKGGHNHIRMCTNYLPVKAPVAINEGELILE